MTTPDPIPQPDESSGQPLCRRECPNYVRPNWGQKMPPSCAIPPYDVYPILKPCVPRIRRYPLELAESRRALGAIDGETVEEAGRRLRVEMAALRGALRDAHERRDLAAAAASKARDDAEDARSAHDECAGEVVRLTLERNALLEQIRKRVPVATGPGCPGPDCPLCNGEMCNKCGAGCGGRPSERCEHDVVERHEPQGM